MSYINLSTYDQEFPPLGTAVAKAKKQEKSAKAVSAITKEPIFTPFPRLPVELRLKIFNMACDTPRVIKVKLTRIGTTPPNIYGNRLPVLGLQYLPNSSVPELLRVNREAREEALKVYKKCFEGGITGEKRNTIYVHPQFDTILISRPGYTMQARHEFQALNFGQSDLDALADTEESWTTLMAWGLWQYPSTMAILPADSKDSDIDKFVDKSDECVICQMRVSSWEIMCLEWLMGWRDSWNALARLGIRGLERSGAYGSWTS